MSDEHLIGTEGNDFLDGGDGNDWLEGLGGDDFLNGGDGNDLLDAGTGNDVLQGGSGDDVYVLGDLGFDFVFDMSGDDELHLPAGVTPDQIERIRFEGSNNLLLRVQSTGEQIMLADWFTGSQSEIERVIFDDGTIWTPETTGSLLYFGTGGSDWLQGTEWGERLEGREGNDIIQARGGDDVLDGGQGSDWMEGGAGNDTYVRGNGPGLDMISETIDATGSNRLKFTSYLSQDIRLSYDPSGGYLALSTTWGEDLLRIAGFNHNDALGYRGVQEYEFLDGAVLSYEQLLERGFDIFATGIFSQDYYEGTNLQDRMFGTFLDETLAGLDGDDFLYGGGGQDTLHGDGYLGDAGDDYLDGGAGNDSLLGGIGSDTYYFDRASGSDFMLELVALEDDLGDIDRIVFGPDILPEDLIISLDPLNRLRIEIAGSPAALTFNEWFNTEISTRIERFEFENGAVLTGDYVTMLLPDAPVVANPIADQAASEDAPFSFTFAADAFDDADIPIGDSLSYSATLADGTAYPSWLSFDAQTRTFSGTPANGDVGTISIRVTAEDETGRLAFDFFDITVANTNDAPTLAQPIADQGAQDTVAFSFTVPAGAFADVDAGDTLTWSAQLAGGGALPAWLTFDAATRTFSGTPGTASIGSINVEVTATDASGAPVSDAFMLAVGAAPDQTVTGTEGNDVLTGGSGNDTIDGLAGADDMHGGLGNDTYYVDNNSDDVFEAAGAGIDTVHATLHHYLDANVENLILDGTGDINGHGNQLANTIIGNSGGNQLDGQEGADTMIGGAGNDLYMVENAGDVVIEAAGEGSDEVHTMSSIASYTLGDNVEHLTMSSATDAVGIGNAVHNQIRGGQGNDSLYGGGGNDVLNGWLGNDYLDGGEGADQMRGDQGDDTYVVDNSGDSVIEGSATWGTDTILAYVSRSLLTASNIENLTLVGNAAINGTGNSLDNVLTGNSAANILSGGTGNDTYYVGAGDTVSENSNAGTDTVNADVSWTLSSNVENLTLTGTAAIDGTGNGSNNTIRGNAGNNTLDGGSGSDTLYGGAGDDVYIVTSSADNVNELAGEGDDTIKSSGTRSIAANVEALVLTGTSGINGTGNSGANLIRGNSGNNTLQGSGGNDILEGGAGNDTLSDTSGNALLNGGAGTDSLTGGSGRELFIGGTGNDSLTTGSGADVIVFNAGDGQDSVAASSLGDTLSLGGGIAYEDLFFSKSGNNLVLSTGGADRVTLQNWYSSPSNRSVLNMQAIAEAMAAFDASSSDPLLNQKVQYFDFVGLVDAFDAARVADPGLTSWALTNALLQEHLGASDAFAFGGDLAYRYGRDGSLAGIGFGPTQAILGAAAFGAAPQALQDDATLQQGAIRLS